MYHGNIRCEQVEKLGVTNMGVLFTIFAFFSQYKVFGMKSLYKEKMISLDD